MIGFIMAKKAVQSGFMNLNKSVTPGLLSDINIKFQSIIYHPQAG